MSAINIPGGDFWFPTPFLVVGANGFVGMSAVTFDATGEKAGYVGQVQFPDRAAGTKNISRVQFAFAGVTKAGGSALTVSLQDISTTTGPPKQPDGTADQTVAIANADAGFVTDAWYRTGTFSAARAVSHGENLAVVIEYDGAGRLGTDTVGIKTVNYLAGGRTNYHSFVLGYVAAWAAVSNVGFSNLVLEFDDGTFGSLGPSEPVKTTTTVAYNTGTAGADEYGKRINFPFPFKIAGAYASGKTSANTTDVALKLYAGTTEVASVTIDGNTLDTTVNNPMVAYFATPYQCLANTDYYITMSPTSVNSVTLYYYTVDSNALLAVAPGGINGHMVKRLDGGAWTNDTTSVPYMGVIISAVDDGNGGGRANLAIGV